MKQIDKQAKERYLSRIRLIKEGAAANPFESSLEQKERIKRAQKDVKFAVEYYFPHYATCECADFQIKLAGRVAKNSTCRELVRWSRGHAKSIWCDLIIPMWLWMRGENIYELIVGNTYDMAVELISDLQAEFEANVRLIHDFGNRATSPPVTDVSTDGRWACVKACVGFAKGRSARIIAPAMTWKIRTRRRTPNDRMRLSNGLKTTCSKTMDGPMRRYLHPNNDPYQRSIQNQLERRHPSWHLDKVVAYDSNYTPVWPQKYTSEYFRQQEADGILSARAEFCHEALVEGKIFTKGMIQWAKAPRFAQFKIITGHWDVAYSGNNDYNAVKVWGLHGFNFWQLKAFCRQCKMEATIRWMYDYEELLPEGIIIQWRVEKQFWGDPVQQAIAAIRAERGRWLNIAVVDRSSTNKYARILTMHPYYQNNRIYYDQREFSDNDMNAGLKQLYGIEPGYHTHDDSPDADQQAIEYLAGFVHYGSAAGGDSGVEMGGGRRSNRM